MDLTPIFRVEFFLDAIINSTTPPEPIFRKEFYLAKIAGADVPIPSPVFREEYYLAKLCGEDVEIPEPIFRKEFWLAKKCGEDVTTPTPIFREEYWLEEWVNGSSPQYQTITGKIVSFLTQRIAPLKIEATLTPIQDLHGQAAPYPPGGGKNKCGGMELGTVTESAAVGTSYANMQSSSTSRLRSKSLIKTDGNAFAVSFDATTYKVAVAGFDADGNYLGRSYAWRAFQTSSPQNYNWTSCTYVAVILGKQDNSTMTTDDWTASKVQLEIGTATAYAPYSNECPISGHTGAEVYVEDEYDAQATPTAEISFGQTVYGGTLTVNEDGTGSVKARPYYASYNGETLVGPWVSSMDAYAPGTTPTTGAQVVDMGGTETTIPLTPGQVEALQGQNVVWVDDSGDIKVTYRSN